MSRELEMREALYQSLHHLMRENEKIVVLDADLGNANGTARLKTDFGDRYVDVGVQEQNMASVAAGFASYGYIPFITTFSAFATRRICDQIAVSICYAKQNVKIVGTDAGISAELNGGTHMSFEDIGVVRSIPDIMIFEPADGIQLAQAVPYIAEHEGPVYMRMLRKYKETVFDDAYRFQPMKAEKLREGTDITVIASGFMVKQALGAARILEAMGIRCEVLNVHTIKPIDEETLLKSIMKTGAAVVAENHNVIGGLGSAVCELSCGAYPVPVGRVGVNDRFGEVGKLPYLQEALGLTEKDIVECCKRVMARKK